MRIGSLFHIVSVLILLGSTAGLYFLFKDKSVKAQRIFLLSLMILNLTQHLFKPLIYPHYRGQGFSVLSTAYNMCALLIVFMPLVFLMNSRFLKNFFYIIGAVAGGIPVVVPVWFFGTPVSELGWEYARFYLCHALLHITAVLPLLLGHHCPAFREFWQIGLGFLMALSLILLNNVIFILLGLSPGIDPNQLYEGLCKHNACLMMGPPGSMPWVGRIARYFSLPIFTGENPAGRYAPILWYAVPVYLGITAGSAIVFLLITKFSTNRRLNS